MPLVGYLLLFIVVGSGFIFIHLLIGKLIRPAKPGAEKMTIYECGEPTIGSSWIQFDLRFYVVALLFVIFDVEVAFFFPWAVVFGQATAIANPDLPAAVRFEKAKGLTPPYPENRAALERHERALRRIDEARGGRAVDPAELADAELQVNDVRDAGRQLAWLAFWDILVFFGVLLVGYAYLWKRGDLDWVRSTAAETGAVRDEAAAARDEALVGAGR
jgi:NADH-quinone oxidoreductase subunit A